MRQRVTRRRSVHVSPRLGRRLRTCALAVTVTVLAAVMTLALTPSADAGVLQEKSWAINSLDVVLDVQEDGDVVAEETWTYYFTGSFSWLEREVPLDAGEGITDIEVRDSEGAPLPEGSGEPGTFFAYEEYGSVWIRVNFDITDAPATYTFVYRTESVVNFGRGDDAVVWYLLDGSIDVEVGSVRATVRLPGSVPSEEMMSDFDAGYGLDINAYSPEASTMVYEATDVLPYTYLYTKTGFPKGVVTHHWTAREVVSFILPKLGFFLPIATFLMLLLIWFKRGRDEPSRVYAKYVSEPPSNLSPGLVGALIDERVDTKEVMATIIDLARRGYLEVSVAEAGGSTGKRGETTFTRIKPLDDLQGYEETVATSLFDGSHPDQVTTGQLKNRFHVHVGSIVKQIYREVTTAGYFKKDPKKTRSAWFAYGFIFIGFAVAAWLIMPRVKVDGWGYFVAGAIASAIVVWIFTSRMPGRTAKGSQEQRKWQAFRNYLEDLTKFQDMEAAKEKYEAYLPYAVAFGIEKQWTRRFEDMTVAPPDWYRPPVIVADMGGGTVRPGGLGGGVGGGFSGVPGGSGGGLPSLGDVSDGLFGALGKVSSAMTSSPSSTGGGRGAWGGGGFGGGGFSGGGFSGGGGGGGMRAG